MLREDLDLEAGAQLDRRYYVWTDAAQTTAADLTGWTAAAHIRPGPLSTTLLVALTCLVEADAVRIQATHAQTAGWPQAWPSLRAAWDIVLTAPDNSPRPPLVGGWITVRPAVTRP